LGTSRRDLVRHEISAADVNSQSGSWS